MLFMSNTAEGRVTFTQALDKQELTATVVIGTVAGAAIGFGAEQIATHSHQRYIAGDNISNLQDQDSNLNVWIKQAKTKEEGTTVQFLNQIRTNNLHQINSIEAATPKSPDVAEVAGFEAGGIVIGIIGITVLMASMKRNAQH